MALRPAVSQALALAMLVCSVSTPAWAVEQQALVVQIHNNLRGTLGSASSWQEVSLDSHLQPGDTLKTGDADAAEVLLPSGASLSLGANTIVRLQDDGGLSGRMLTGKVRLIAPPAGTAQLVAGEWHLSGTDAEAIVERVSGEWRINVLAGKFSLQGQTGPLTEIEAGKSLLLGNGQPRTAMLSHTRALDLEELFPLDHPTAAAIARTGTTTPANIAAVAGPNRWVATGLSVVLPGTGQLYGGELPRGLAYLGLDCIALGVGYWGFTNGQKTTALTAAGVALGVNLLSPIDAFLFTNPAPPKAEKLTNPHLASD